ncbi:hypothetical protein E2C00_00240 [Streptomyces sp. WAC05374]|uniref:hypothetical protein n=1 Tax=Streptomyces sp. WAC05374 TaxID=2487420 RepID=UPI000F88E193|nr:hypothetical protein [Streptomyces sp. WAC05374]RST19640.1 hypothetical protein EF905_00705 [Streptomyces sp. WAC05374]TDF50022.1 hypothetical protein E2B92_00215 [Streptomyces sp. WAC05374]TDF57748.1 hypothetical protein E2C02_08005 [Streptomyces sp. WAC05374]TDF60276.1 hypothetical protein E2C00_00240 [Streptomyces sp. WAC05374]
MTEQMAWQDCPWERRVYPLGAPPAADAYGWALPAPFSSRVGVPLAAERQVPVLVLRAERGAGKSKTLLQERKALDAAGLSATWVDLGRCQDALLAAQALEAALRPPQATGEWHVLLDGLDEGLNALPSLDRHIVARLEALSESARASLKLRITCRTARWPRTLQDDLIRLWGPGGVALRGLAPLSREEARLAADLYGVGEPDGFIDEVQRRGLVALAIHPVTLRQLVVSFGDNGTLPATTEAAYLEACRHLCTETQRPTDPAALDRQVPAGDLLAVAARIAAAAQFGGYQTISDQAQPAQGDLTLSQLSGGGGEPGPLGSAVSCTTRELRQAVESGLFVPVGELRWTFAHRSYQEFLAARFLRTRRVHAEVQRELLWIGDGSARHVLPVHQETAAWRCTSDPDLFEEILRDDPLVLQLADLQALPPSGRARAAQAFLSHFERDDTAAFQWSASHRFAHPELENQLQQYLEASTEPNLLYTAVALARSCLSAGLADPLLKIAEHTGVVTEIRVSAIDATVVDAATLGRINTLARDASPEVAAAALQRLWPQHISLDDFLDLVPDPDPAYIGTAYMLQRELPGMLSPTDLSTAMDWATRILSAPGGQGSKTLAIALTAQAVRNAKADGNTPQQQYIAKAVQALLALADCDQDFLYSDQASDRLADLGAALADRHNVRRLIAHRLLEKAAEAQLITLDSISNAMQILPTGDALYWMNQWGSLSTQARKLAAHAVRIAKPDDPVLLAKAEQARMAHPSLRTVTAWWDTPPTENPRQRTIREEREQRRKELTYSDEALRTALDGLHVATPNDVRTAWRRVLAELHKTHDGSAANRHPSVMSLARKAPSCPAPGSNLAHALQQAAQHALRLVPPLTADDLTPHGSAQWTRIPEIAAFAVAGTDVSVLPATPEQAAGWVLALASAPAYDDHEVSLRNQLLPVYAHRAADHLPPLLADVLNRADDNTARGMTGVLAASTRNETRSTLLTWATAPVRTPEQWATTLHALAAHADTEARDLLRQEVAADPAQQHQGSKPRTRWIRAAHALMFFDNQFTTVLPEAWPAIRDGLSDETVLAEFLNQLASTSRNWPDATGELSEKQLADLYTLVVDHLGTTILALSYGGEPGIVTTQDRLGDLARSLPTLLAAKESPQAATHLQRLANRYADVWQLRNAARTTARAAAARHATPLTPEELLRLARDPQLRRIADERQLHDIILESLHRFEAALHRPNGLVIALWNRDQHGVNHTNWWPCWEEDFSDIVAAFLAQDIGGHRVVINREVQVRRPGFPGLRTDIQIEAPAVPGASDDPIKVVIECKGCWNTTLPMALTDQLVGDYLQTPRTAGVYLIGYFDCDHWGIKRRQCPVQDHTLSKIQDHLQRQAQHQQHEQGVVVSALVLDCRLPPTTTGASS